jgi:DNA polymerase
MTLVTISASNAIEASETKAKAYASLVAARKQCHRCQDVVNPSSRADGRFDTIAHVGPWSDWQGNLNAEIMVVGQEWGGTKNYEEQSGRDSDSDPTNENLIALMKSIDHEVDVPSNLQGRTITGPYFFTNAVLCLRNGAATSDKESNDISAKSFKQCGTSFLRPQIDLIKPRTVLVLGKLSWFGLMKSFGLASPSRHTDTVEGASVRLNDHTEAIPLFHCGAGSTNRNRSFDLQLSDWARGKRSHRLK